MATQCTSRTAARALFAPQCRPQPHTTPYSFRPCASQSRSVFNLPYLPSHDRWKEAGITLKRTGASKSPADSRPLYSKQGYDIAWTTYQQHLLYNLNYMTASDPELQSLNPQKLALRCARDPAQAALFNHASMAYNNAFFFDGLTDTPTPLESYAGLHSSLSRTFGSIDALRDLFRYTADGMFGCGFVWLVFAKRDGNDNAGVWRVLATYNAGTPHVLQRNQSADMNVQGQRGAKAGNNRAGSFGPHSESDIAIRSRPLGAPASVTPVLCLNVWQHAYMRDFQVHGKRLFVEKWWDHIDWNKVNNLAPGEGKAMQWD